MYSHKELKRIIIEHNLVSHLDHIIAVNNGWTDLRFTALDKRLTSESKYFLATQINDSSCILYLDNLSDLRSEIDECMIKKEFFQGYDKKNNRVHVHYEGEGIFRFGNINQDGTALRKQFEICSLHELTKRKDYELYINLLSSKERHRAIQVLLAELGINLGYSVKLASNDESTILKNNPLSPLVGKVLSFSDLNLMNIHEKSVENAIDKLDVLWCNPLNNIIVVAFEVERSKNYNNLLQRFSRLAKDYSKQTYYICVGSDFKNFKNVSSQYPWNTVFSKHNLGYLTLNSLFKFLEANRYLGSYIDKIILFKKLFNEEVNYLFTNRFSIPH